MGSYPVTVVANSVHVESRIPSSAQLYVYDCDTEAKVNMRCCVRDGLDKEIVATVQRVLSQVTSFVQMSLELANL